MCAMASPMRSMQSQGRKLGNRLRHFQYPDSFPADKNGKANYSSNCRITENKMIDSMNTKFFTIQSNSPNSTIFQE